MCKLGIKNTIEHKERKKGSLALFRLFICLTLGETLWANLLDKTLRKVTLRKYSINSIS